MANEVLYDADAVAAVDEYVPGLPDANEVFTIHARFRRIADGAVGDAVSVDVELDPAETNRTEFVGCANVPTAPLSVLSLALLARRRRRRSAQ
jgi:MYXO-CTERM domain-containing protein